MTSTQPDDEELVAKSIGGDADSFNELILRWERPIYALAYRTIGREEDARDVCQETFLRAFRAYRALPPGANVRAWLFTIATNLGRNHFRAQSRRRRAYAAVALEAPAGAPDRTDGRVLADEARVRVEQVIGGLPEKQRLAFIMRKMHELDYAEIGTSLRCSEESARAHVFQALRKIRKGLDRELSAETEARP